MKQPEYIKFHENLCAAARSLSVSKNHDYADPTANQEDPFAVFKNFMQVESMGVCTVEQGFLTRMSDKLTRLGNLLKPKHEQAVKDESVQDTLMDLINYCCLLAGYLEVKRNWSRKAVLIGQKSEGA